MTSTPCPDSESPGGCKRAATQRNQRQLAMGMEWRSYRQRIGFRKYRKAKNGLTVAEQRELEDLLLEYSECFNGGNKRVACTNLLLAWLDIGDHAPTSQPPRRLNSAMRRAVQELVDELEKAGIIDDSNSSWGSPIVVVKKSSGGIRLCGDNRKLNKFVIIPKQPLPRIHDILASLNGKKCFSVMDMCSGFHQIEIEPEDRPTTSFVTPDCQKQDKRLPVGFASSPAIFQKMIIFCWVG